METVDILHVISTLVVGVITAIITAFIALKKLNPETKVIEAQSEEHKASSEKLEAEASEIMGKAWGSIVDRLILDLDSARKDLSVMRAEQAQMRIDIDERDEQRKRDLAVIRILRRQVSALMAQMAEVGIVPFKVNGYEAIIEEEK